MVDGVRRMWPMYAFAGIAIFLQIWVVSRAHADGVVLKSPADLFAWSLTACWMLAFMPAALDSREIALLPVSRREMWVARWWLAAVWPAILIAAVFVFGRLVFRSETTIEQIFTVAVYCSFYGGCYMAVTAVFPLTVMASDRSVTAALVRFFGIMIGGLALPFWFTQYLPREISGARNPVLGFIIAAAGLTLASYFNRPAIVERASAPKQRGRARTTETRAGFRDVLPGNSLTGLSRLFWVHARQIALLAPCAFATIWFIEVFTGNLRSGSMRDILHLLRLMPFDVDYTGDLTRGFNLMMFVFVSISDKPRDLMQRARALRVLPLTANRLALVFAALAVVEAAVIWLWLLGVHIALIGSLPNTLRPDIFAIFCGALAMTRSIESLFQSSFAGRAVAAVLFLGPVLIATFLIKSPQLAMVIFGVAAFAGGVYLQAHLLRRRHKLYKFTPPTLFGRTLPS